MNIFVVLITSAIPLGLFLSWYMDNAMYAMISVGALLLFMAG